MTYYIYKRCCIFCGTNTTTQMHVLQYNACACDLCYKAMLDALTAMKATKEN